MLVLVIMLRCADVALCPQRLMRMRRGSSSTSAALAADASQQGVPQRMKAPRTTTEKPGIDTLCWAARSLSWRGPAARSW